MNNAASAKVQKYREDYSASDVNKAFLPALLSTSGCINCEFMRLLYIFAHRQTLKFFEAFGEESSHEAAPNTFFITARLSGSHALKPLPFARTWHLTLPGTSPYPFLARCMPPSSLLTLLAVPNPVSPPPCSPPRQVE